MSEIKKKIGITGYELSRNWFDFSFEEDKTRPIHTALYLYICELSNRLGDKERFGLPSIVAMECLGIKSHNTYINTLTDLIDFGFIILYEKSKNQYTANVVGLSKNDKAQYEALDKANIKHCSSTIQSIDSIDKPINKETNKQRNKKSVDESKDSQRYITKKLFDVKEEDITDLKTKEYFNLATAFYQLFKQNLEHLETSTAQLERTTFKSAITPIRLMLEVDKINKDQLRAIWDFLKDHDFWSANIQSTKKLREKFPMLQAQLKKESNDKKRNKNRGSKQVTYSDEFIEKHLRNLHAPIKE